MYSEAKLFAVSDSAFSVEFGNEINEQLRGKVAALAQLLDSEAPQAVIEIIPSYRSVLVEYDPLLADAAQMATLLTDLARRAESCTVAPGKTIEIPVCYGGAYGPDLTDIAAHTGLSREEVVALHSTGGYPVYMIGFTPGFPYLGGMDQRLATPRLDTPRTLIPPGSVGIAGEQTGIYPLATPGGWRLIGRTPLKLFDKTKEDPFLLAAGDIVRFVPIDEATYLEMREEATSLQVEGAEDTSPETEGAEPTSHKAGGAEASPLETVRAEATSLATGGERYKGVSGKLRIVQKGMLTTIQDIGRTGYQRFGIPASGAMDWFAAELANILVGNPADAPLLEATIIGPAIDMLDDCCFAVTGATFLPKLNGVPVPMNSCVFAPSESRLELGSAQQGARGYIAFTGGLDVALDLGSASTYTKAGLGGIEGKGQPLQNGDHIKIKPSRRPSNIDGRIVHEDLLPPYSAAPVVRLIAEARPDYFAANAVEALITDSYQVTNNSDRMGYRLEGPAIPYASGCDGNIISDGTTLGSIQVVGGKPIILMTDRQTIGGYAKIGSVIKADLPLVAQLKPGDTLRFTTVSIQDAQEAYRAISQRLSRLADIFQS